MLIHTNYLRSIFDLRDRKRVLAAMIDTVTRAMVIETFEALAFSGISGAGIAFSLADALGLPIINVRKDDSSHFVIESVGTLRWLEGAVDAKSYLIVDDFMSTGLTVERIVEKISDYNPEARCTGIALYSRPWGVKTYWLKDRGVPVYYGGI